MQVWYVNRDTLSVQAFLDSSNICMGIFLRSSSISSKETKVLRLKKVREREDDIYEDSVEEEKKKMWR